MVRAPRVHLFLIDRHSALCVDIDFHLRLVGRAVLYLVTATVIPRHLDEPQEVRPLLHSSQYLRWLLAVLRMRFFASWAAADAKETTKAPTAMAIQLFMMLSVKMIGTPNGVAGPQLPMAIGGKRGCPHIWRGLVTRGFRIQHE